MVAIKLIQGFIIYINILVTTFATWHQGPIGVFCHFGDFGNFLAIFLTHFDPWAICDNSLQ